MISSKNAIFDLLCFIKDVQDKKIDIFIFYSVRYSQLLLFYFPEEASRNTFLHNQIKIFGCKRLKHYFNAQIFFTFYVYYYL